MSNNHSQRLESLSPAQRQLLLKALRRQAARSEGGERIARRPRPEEPAPLSFSQERQWVLHQLTPDSPAYNVSVALLIDGVGEPGVLEAALNEIVRRHEILRTTFPTVDGEPVQVVAPAAHFAVPADDLRGLPADELEAETRRLVGEESRRLFDLAAGPLFRAKLIRQSETAQVIVVTMPHIVTDGWSMGQFFQELAAGCRARLAGAPSPQAELEIQYADYAVWQREWLKGEVLEEHLSYWRKQFEGAPSVLAMPTDRPRPAVQNYRGALYAHEFSRELHEGLKELSRREGATMFMTLVAGLDVLLSRYTGQEDIVVGSYLANRNRAETEKLIGFFVNTVALRTSLAGDPTFRELLGRVRDAALGAYAHQELPFERILEAAHHERTPSHAPLFQVGLNFGNISAPDIAEFPGVTISRLKRGDGLVVGSSQLDLTLDIQGLERGMVASLLYDTTLFDEATVARMMTHFEALLSAVVADPDARVGDIDMLGESERRALLEDWSNAGAKAKPAACVHELFAEQAARTPEAEAVVCGSDRLTYAELDARSSRLAARLRAQGVGPESTVGVLMNRSAELITALLGVLKAGAAYVPLDPEYPRERLRAMVASSRPSVMLACEATAGRVPQGACPVLLVGAGVHAEDCTNVEDAGRFNAPLSADNPAYVIYTSGSTGTPKGVVVTHRSLSGYTETAAEEFGICAGDRVLQFTSISFDTSAEEIYPCLTSGATLVLRDDSMLNSVTAFLRRCAEWGVTVLDLPTAFWHELTSQMAEDEGLRLPPSVRLVIIGGERALPERVQAWRSLAPAGVRLVNTYGPTEATVVSTMFELTGAEDVSHLLGEVSIGSAVRHAEIYVLDRNLRPVPVGVHGELYVGGGGLARGYLGHPDLTAEKFVPDPFSNAPGARLYRTGDRVSFRTDGTLDFHGRCDSQVKVRGFRVDLGDIETALSECAALRQSAVVAREDEPGRVRLVAYFVAAGQEPATAEALRGFLSERLPAHMIPTAFVALESMPMTTTGKLDRRALLAAAPPERAAREVEFAAPSTTIEEVLAGVWAKVLKVAEVGVNDNFFALGGHSLLAMQVVYQVEQLLEMHLPLRAFFEEPTVAGLALVVEEILLEEIELLSEEDADELASAE